MLFWRRKDSQLVLVVCCSTLAAVLLIPSIVNKTWPPHPSFDVKAASGAAANVAGILAAGSLALSSNPTFANEMQVPAVFQPAERVVMAENKHTGSFRGLEAPALQVDGLLEGNQLRPTRQSKVSLGVRCAILMSIAPIVVMFINYRRERDDLEPEFAVAGINAPLGDDSFDPLGLGATVLQMTEGDPLDKKKKVEKAREKASLLDAERPSPDRPARLYPQRWVQLAYLSLFALISDWVCFSVAAAPESWYNTFGHEPSQLVDIFLFTNVISCFMFTDVARYFGLRKVIVSAGFLMAAGCLLRSGIPFVGGLPSYELITLGTIFVGAAQPFFQCSPPLLSATWFGAKERALATATAINFNQVGIAAAFLVGGVLGQTTEGLAMYFSIVTVITAAVAAGSYWQFKDRPPSPPSASAAIREAAEEALAGERKFEIKFPAVALSLLKQNAFRIPLAGFVASIGVTNIISTFTDSSLRRAGFLSTLDIDLSGAAFQLAIVLGGIFVGSYVDRTKKFKQVTMTCFYISAVLLSVLSIAFGNDVNLPEWLVLVALLGVGATLGPVQPINAELAVEATYPSDENAIESVQQLCGNLFSALLVPLCELAANYDVDYTTGVVDMKGDSLVILVLLLATTVYYSTFNAPLKRAELDNALPLNEE